MSTITSVFMLNSFLFWFVAAGIRRCRPGQRPMQTAPAFAARVARALQRRRLYRVLLRGFRVTTLLAAPNHGRESAHVWIPPARGSPLPAAAGALPRTAAPDNGGRPGRRYCPPRRGSHRLLAGEDPFAPCCRLAQPAAFWERICQRAKIGRA